MKPSLHFVVDPLCGWCYGASPLFEAAQSIDGLNIVVHGGGMLVDERRKQITPDWKNFVTPHDQRIEALTQQPFGDDYKNGLLNDTSVLLDSAPPIKAIMAVEELGFSGVTMLKALQKNMYFEGRNICVPETLYDVAGKLGMDVAAFKARFDGIEEHELDAHMAQSRRILHTIKGNGFPSAGLIYNGGEATPLNISAFYGKPQDWKDYLTDLL